MSAVACVIEPSESLDWLETASLVSFSTDVIRHQFTDTAKPGTNRGVRLGGGRDVISARFPSAGPRWAEIAHGGVRKRRDG